MKGCCKGVTLIVGSKGRVRGKRKEKVKNKERVEEIKER